MAMSKKGLTSLLKANRSLFITGILALLFTAYTTQFVLNVVDKGFTREVRFSLESVLKTAVRSVNVWFRDTHQMAQHIANEQAIQTSVQQLLDNKDSLQENDPAHLKLRHTMLEYIGSTDFINYYVIGPNAFTLSAYHPEDIGRPNPLAQIPEIAATAWQGATAFAHYHWLEASPSSELNSSEQDESEPLYIAVPVNYAQGKVAAILILEVKGNDSLSNILSALDHDAVNAFAYDGLGAVFRETTIKQNDIMSAPDTHPEPGEEITGTNFPTYRPPSHDHMVTVAEPGESGIMLEPYRSHDGTEVVGAWHWINSMNIGIGVEMESKQAFQLMNFVHRSIYVCSSIALISIMALLAVFIHGRRKAQEVQNRLRAIVETAYSGILVTDQHGIIESINPAVEKIFGYTEKELVGSNINMLMPDELRSQHIKKMEDYTEGRRDIGLVGTVQEMEAQRADGSRFPISINVNRLELDSGLHFAGVIHDISKRKEAEESLKKSSERFRAISMIAENTDNGALILNAASRIEWVNPGFCKVTGYTLDEVKGKKAADVLHGPKTDPVTADVMTKSLIAGKRFKGEIIQYCKNGRTFWNQFELAPVFDDDHNLIQIIAVGRDISEQKRLVQELRQQKESAENANKTLRLTQQALNRANIAELWVNVSSGRILRANTYASEYLGYSKDALTSMLIESVMPDTSVEKMLSVVSEKGWGRFESVHLTHGGVEVPVEITSLFQQGMGDGDGMLINFVMDISERKAQEATLRRTKERLEASTSAGIIGTWEWDVVNEELYLDPVIVDLYGITDELVPDRIEGFTEFAHPDERETAYRFINSLLKNRKQNEGEFRDREAEYRVVWPNRSIHHLKMASRTTFDQAGNATRLTGVAYDLTEHKNFEAELTKAMLEAQEANRAKSSFLATMSHEIRTPLNGVVGTIDLLSHSGLNSAQLDLTATAQESAVLLQGIIDDILDFSKIEAGRLDLDTIPFDLEKLVENLGDGLLPVANSKGVQLYTRIEPELPNLLGDPVRLRQVLYNLTGNAIKFSADPVRENGQVLVEILVDSSVKNLARDKVALCIRITDNGIGMSQKVQDKLFSPFEQGDGKITRRFGGTGLGLVITKRLVTMMRGHIQVDSKEGQGSTFSIFLQFGTKPDSLSPPSHDLSGIEVLFLNGSDISHRILATYLEPAGAVINPVTQEQVSSAIEEARAADNSVVIAIDSPGDLRRAEFLRKMILNETEYFEPRFLLIERGQRRYARKWGEAGVTLDVNNLRRRVLLNAVATVVGKASLLVNQEAPKIISEAPPLNHDEALKKGRLILLVDDNPTNLKVIGQQISLLGYLAETAENGVEGLEKWKSGQYSLLLTDCHMPEMDGYQLSLAVRELEIGTKQRKPIIAITADALKGTAQACIDHGMDDYLTKPVQLATLQKALQKWLPASPDDEDSDSGDQKPAPQEIGSTFEETDLVPAAKEEPLAEQEPSAGEEPSAEKEPSAGEEPSAIQEPASDGETSIDPQVLAGFVGTEDKNMLTGFYQHFLETNAPTLDEIHSAHDENDLSAVSKLAHKLKSASRTIGANALADCCLALEMAGKEGDEAALNQAMPQLRGLFEKAEIWIKNYCDS